MAGGMREIIDLAGKNRENGGETEKVK